MPRNLIFQLGRLGADGFEVGQVLLCSSEPLAEGLQCFVELLRDREDDLQLLLPDLFMRIGSRGQLWREKVNFKFICSIWKISCL